PRGGKLGLVDGEEQHARRWDAAALVEAAHGAGSLRQALEQEHARHHRIVGKMALEERLAERHVLDADARLVTADGHDAVDEKERITVRQELQDILRPELR